MSIAIIAEYNPFHNGHIYQLAEAKKRFPHDQIYIIMSGEYVQRGEIAVASFASRKQAALEHGATAVIELPIKYATQAAHIFAHGAMNIVNQQGIDKIFFGSESNDPHQLMMIAQTINKHQQKYDQLVRSFLKQGGNSFPKACALALTELVGKPITMPNDILGLEYCKAIVNNNYQITPHTLKRTVPFHDDQPHGKIASASYIRTQFWAGQDYAQYTPMQLDRSRPRIEDFYPSFQTIISTTPADVLAQNALISEGMENLFKKHIDAKTLAEFVSRTNSRRYTSSRIKRTVLHILLTEHKKLIKS